MDCIRIAAHTIFDGSGRPPFAGMVAVGGGVIQSVEPLAPDDPALAAVPEDAPALAPGFIDAHGHSDLSIFAMPAAEGKCAQGITTEIAGNCGLSAFPLTERNRGHLEELYRIYRTELSWTDFPSYRRKLAGIRARLDVLGLVGHNTLRAAVAGYEKKHLSSGEIAAMRQLLDRELAAGALGLSAGLLYVPGCFADGDELTALLEVVARHDRIFTIHLRSEGDRLEEALAETLAAARRAKLRKLHISHLKTAGVRNFGKLPLLLAALQSADMRVTGDIYPYTAAMTQCGAILPSPWDEMSDSALTAHLADARHFQTALTALRAARDADYWSRVMIVNATPADRDCCGVMLPEAARKRGVAPEELFLRIIRRDAAVAMGAFHTLSRENMETLAALPNVVPGSDESARNVDSGCGLSHPRGFGAMPEYFRLRRRQGASPESIIARMTGLPAAIFGLSDRGLIAPGRRADLVRLDLEHFQSHATYAMPHCPATGAEILAC